MKSIGQILLFAILAVLLTSPASFSQPTYTYYCRQDSGVNAPEGGDIEHPWRDLGYAIETIKNNGDIMPRDTVYLKLSHGPFHIATESDSTLKWKGAGRPNLIIEGEPGGTIITAVDSLVILWDWDPQPGGDYYRHANWPEEYDWDWKPFTFNPDTVYPAPPEDYDTLSTDGIEKWLAYTVRVDSSEYNTTPGDSSSHLGHWMIRREAVVIQHRDEVAGTHDLRHFFQNPETWIDTNEVGLDAYYANFRADPLDRYIKLRTAFNLSDTSANKVYVPALRQIFRADSVRYIKLKNLNFAFTSSFYNGSAVNLRTCTKVVVEDCTFEHVGGIGLSIKKCSSKYDYYDDNDNRTWRLNDDASYGAVWLENVKAEHCGNYGITINTSVGVTLEDCSTYNNNWLCYKAGTMTFACGGSKCYNLHRARINGLTSSNNYGFGWWIDQDGKDIDFNDFTAENNLSAGLFLEVSPGPISIDTSLFRSNGLVDTLDWVLGGANTNLLLNTTRDVDVTRATFDASVYDDRSCIAVSDLHVRRWDPLFPVGNPDGDNGRYILHQGSGTFTSCTFKRYEPIVGTPPTFIWKYNIADRLFCEFFGLTDFADDDWYNGSGGTPFHEGGLPPEIIDWIVDNCLTSPIPIPYPIPVDY